MILIKIYHLLIYFANLNKSLSFIYLECSPTLLNRFQASTVQYYGLK
jgi:hypothetical protein